MTWTCPKCGKVHLSEYDMKRCNCQSSQPCPDCRGTGKRFKRLAPLWIALVATVLGNYIIELRFLFCID